MDINERKAVHTERLKGGRIEDILRTMAKYSISTDDLIEYERVSDGEKMSRIHKIQANVRRNAENLKKAREAKRSGKQAKGKDVRPVEVRSEDSDNEE